MYQKHKRLLAIIALVFVLIFTVTFIIFLYNPKMGNGAVAFTALFSGIIGIGLFFVIRMFEKNIKSKEEFEKQLKEGAENVDSENNSGEEEALPFENESEKSDDDSLAIKNESKKSN